MSSRFCRLVGHKIVDVPWRYEQGETTDHTGRVVSVTWACCEVCSRCGLEVWTPW